VPPPDLPAPPTSMAPAVLLLVGAGVVVYASRRP
jgi:hypothetical protein